MLLAEAGAAPAPAALTPRPGRSVPWILLNAVRGTWFLVLIHLGALGLLFTGTTWLDWAVFVPVLLLRGFLTTAVLHRYFSHRCFKTSRAFQFLLGFLACANMQRGPLWWAAIHRHHHRHSDEPADAHSPIQGGFLWSYWSWTEVVQGIQGTGMLKVPPWQIGVTHAWTQTPPSDVG